MAGQFCVCGALVITWLISRMPADFYIDAQRGVVFTKAVGVLGRAEAVDHIERLSRHPDFRPDFNHLADFRDVSTVTLSSDTVRELATMSVFGPHSHRAFVVSSDLQFGLGRVFGSYRHVEGEKGIKVFREMSDALRWLSLPSEPELKLFTNLYSPPE